MSNNTQSPLSIVDQLRAKNPYKLSSPGSIDRKEGWNEACDTLQSLLTPPAEQEQRAESDKVIKNTIWSLVHTWQMSDGDETKDRWLAVEKYVLSIANPNIASLPDKLREFNPYFYNKEQRLGVVAWNKCCDKLSEILKQSRGGEGGG